MPQKVLISLVLLQYHPTPIQEIEGHPACVKAGVTLLIKREDMNHPTISGNKWWKLKYNLEAACNYPHKTILTFGGAYSNHIYAAAAAAKEMNLRSIGIIRGEETLPLNHTLQFALEQGMQIHYVSREAYRQKTRPDFISSLYRQFGKFFLIPEGGSNLLAVKGCAEFAENELEKIKFDHLIMPVATGGTLAGIVCGLKGMRKVHGVSVLKNAGFLSSQIERMIMDFTGTPYKNWSLLTEYHGGGFAKKDAALSTFIEEMKREYNIPLDRIYTGKLLKAVISEIEAGSFKPGSTILVLHTGGLQGILSNSGA